MFDDFDDLMTLTETLQIEEAEETTTEEYKHFH